MAARNLGELLVRENLIDLKQLEEAKREQKKSGGRLGTALLKLGYMKDKELTAFLSQRFHVPSVDLQSYEIDPEAIKMLNREVCVKHCVVPVSKIGNNLAVAFADPGDVFARDDLTFLTKCKIEVLVAPEPMIMKAIDSNYESSTKVDFGSLVSEMERSEDAFNKTSVSQVDIGDTNVSSTDSPVVRFINAMLTDAIQVRASDIHIEPYENRTRVRFRIDGKLSERVQPPHGLTPAIIARVKVMSQLNIAERRRPQDGRMKVNAGGNPIDFRVSILPTLFGEKCVLRILDKSNLQVDMTKLGFDPKDLEKFKDAIHQPQGMVLVTGPTGSGKTTTIYSALADLNTVDRNISTAEDPPEFNLEGINQVQINHEIEFGFPEALRSFLRQDPNVIMVGEIRDLETAEIAFKAAATGHLVVSTLHTNGAPATIARLLDMGVEGYLIASTITLVVAQRLIRRNCTSCSVPITVQPQVLTKIGVPESDVGSYKLMKGEGCRNCGGVGMKGRIAIFELMEMTGKVNALITSSEWTPLAVRQAAIKDGMRSLRQAALERLKLGLTTIEEVATETPSDI